MKKCILILLALSSTITLAQEDEKSWYSNLGFSGSVDAYYRLNLNSYNREYDDFPYQEPGTSFANRPGFAIGMANLIFSYEGEKVGAVADLVFGPRGEDAVFLSSGNSSIVNQLYVYWNVTDRLKLTLGNWNTFLGYEVISPTANFNYSTSYMFSNGPFSHTGIKADLTIDDQWSAMLALMNPTDFTEFNPVGTYSLGGQLGYSFDSGSAFLNLLYGDQDGKLDASASDPGESSAGATFQVDLTAGTDLTEDFYLGLNATYNTTNTDEINTAGAIEDFDGDSDTDFGFYGVAAYLQYSLSETFALGTRAEYFEAFNGPVDANVFAVTLSGNAKVGDLTLIPELRLDTYDEEVILDSDFEFQKGLASFLLAAVYSF
ncbi:porin [Croceiramulus getboli]|nr:porin [Flavobacteriaceae bacterium YJPT1-3]